VKWGLPDSGEVLQWRSTLHQTEVDMHDGQSRREQEVGALQRREVVCTRWWICVMDQEGVGGRTMVDYEWRSVTV
jgi:hypothetical protein